MATKQTEQGGHAPTAAVGRLGFVAVAFVVALACLFCGSVPWLTLFYRAANPAGDFLPFGPLVILGIVCWVFAPLARGLFGSSAKVVRAGLLFYCLAVSLGGFSTEFTVMKLPQIVTSLRYFATPQNRFEDEVIPRIPDTLIITNEVATRGFWEGARSGGIPWGLWIGPLLRWGVFAILYLITGVAMLGLFRRRWIQYERLPFPLAEIPLFVAGHGQFGMVRDNQRRRNTLLLVGMLLVALVHSYNALNKYIPAIPPIPMKFSLSGLFETSPWNVLRGSSYATAWANIQLIGISYLMPSAMALGIFAFFLLVVAVRVASHFLGDPTLGALNWDSWASQKDHQAGAYCGLLIFALWSLRADLAEMARGLSRQIAGSSKGNEHPDRWMLVAFVGGLLGICWWSVSAGISFWVALSFMLAALALTFGFAIITAQAGLPALQIDTLPAQLLTAFVPVKRLGMRNMALIGLFNTICFGYKRYALMPGALQGLKIADSERVADRVFLTSLLVAGAIVIAANSVSLLHLGHNEGRMITTATAWHVRPGTTGTPHHGIIWAQQLMTEEHPQLRYHWMVMGAVSMWVFQSLYRHFVWWPIHPVGMLLPVGYLITTQWFSVMVGWAIGRFIAKYAGPRAYLRLRPLFLGLVLGDAAARALWVFIDVRLGTFVLPQ